MLKWDYDFEELSIRSEFCKTPKFCTSFSELKLVKGENGGIYMVYENVYATGKTEKCEVQIDTKNIYEIFMNTPKMFSKGWISFKNKNGTIKNCQIKMESKSKEEKMLAHVSVSLKQKATFELMYEIFTANGFKVTLC